MESSNDSRMKKFLDFSLEEKFFVHWLDHVSNQAALMTFQWTVYSHFLEVIWGHARSRESKLCMTMKDQEWSRMTHFQMNIGQSRDHYTKHHTYSRLRGSINALQVILGHLRSNEIGLMIILKKLLLLSILYGKCSTRSSSSSVRPKDRLSLNRGLWTKLAINRSVNHSSLCWRKIFSVFNLLT